MKTEFILELRDTHENQRKYEHMNRLEVAFDDPNIPLPASYYELVESIPWGSKIHVLIEIIE